MRNFVKPNNENPAASNPTTVKLADCFSSVCGNAVACAATGCCLAPATSLVVASPSETSTLVLVALMVPLLFATVLVAVACGAVTPVD